MIDIAGLAEHLRRVTVEVTDAGGRSLEGHLVARDADVDLALLSVPGTGIPAATLAGPDEVRIGSFVVAVGHPLGVRGALTAGIVCAIGPIVPGGRSWIQADLRLAPGNSGGPLADAVGRVVGLNARAAGPLALAVPTGQLTRFVRAAGV